MNSDADRIVFLDWLRAIAIFMVLLIHACEPFYLDAEGTAIASKFDAVWVTIIDSAMRAAVPLFVIASAFLLFPVRNDLRVYIYEACDFLRSKAFFFSECAEFFPVHVSAP